MTETDAAFVSYLFQADISKVMQAKKKRLESLTKNYMKGSQHKLEQLWSNYHGQRFASPSMTWRTQQNCSKIIKPCETVDLSRESSHCCRFKITVVVWSKMNTSVQGYLLLIILQLFIPAYISCLHHLSNQKYHKNKANIWNSQLEITGKHLHRLSII